MAASGDSASANTQKLEMVIKKGDMIISMLEKQGIDTVSVKDRMTEAKSSFSDGEIGKAYKLAQQCIGDLMKLKDQTTPKGKQRSKRGKGVFALIRDNTAEMQKKIEEWRIIIKGWREKGYTFEEDESLFSRPFEEIEKRFISIGEQIEKAEVIRGKLKQLREDFSHVGKSYKSKIDEIEKAVFRLDRLDDINRRVDTLKTTLRSVEGRFKTLRNRISRFRRKGLNTSSLEEMVENDEDLDYLDKQFSIYESNVDFLMKEKQKLKTFKQDPLSDRFQKNISEIERIQDDPWMLDHMVELMLSLEKSLDKEKKNMKKKDEEKKRREEIRHSIEKYKDEGFKVDMVEQLLDEDINLLEEEYDIFIRQAARLKSLKEKLFKLDATGFEEEISAISGKLFDPTNIDQIDKELNELKERILNHRIRSQKMENAVKEWTGMGFKVSKLENLLKRDIEDAEKVYEDYKVRIKELNEYQSRLQDMKYRDVSDLVHKLELKIKNPELIETVRKEMSQLQKKVSSMQSLREKRKELNGLLKVWKGQGYKIDNILKVTREENSVEGLENIILHYTRAIASLETLRSEFPAEERGWFSELEDHIKENISDPDMSSEVISTFEELRELNEKEEKRRGEISRKLKELSNRGIDISKVEPLLLGDSKILTEEYEVFKDKVKRLLKLKAGLLKEAHKKGDQTLELFAKGLKDPFSIETYETQAQAKKEGKSIPSVQEDDKEKEIRTLRDKARELFKNNRFMESKELFEKVLEMDPKDKQGLFYIKKIQLKLRSGHIQEPGEEPAPHPEPEPTPEAEPVEEAPEPEGEKENEEGSDVEKEEPTEIYVSGKEPDKECLSCKGSGQCIWCNGSGKCSTCEGTGKAFGEECTTCKGDGKCSVCKGSGKCSWCML